MVLDAAKLSSATALAQILPLLVLPFLADQVGFGALGVLAVFIAVVSVCSLLATLRLEPAVVLSESDAMASSIVNDVRVIALTVSVASLLFTIFACLQFEEPVWLSVAMMLGIYLIASNKVLLSKLNYSRAYNGIAFHNILSVIFVQVSHLAVAFWFPVTVEYALIGSFVVGNALTHICLLKMCRQHSLRVNFGILKSTVLTNFRFVKYELPSDFLHQCAQMLPVTIIAAFYGDDKAGIYSVAEKLVLGPINMVSGALGTVLFKQYAANDKALNVGENVKLVFVLVALAVMGSVLYLLLFRPLVSLAFTSDVAEIIDVSNFLILYGLVVFLSGPFAGILWVNGKQQVNLALAMLTVVVRIFGLLLLPEVTFIIAVIYLSAASVLPRLLLHVVCLKQLMLSRLQILGVLGIELTMLLSVGWFLV